MTSSSSTDEYEHCAALFRAQPLNEEGKLPCMLAINSLLSTGVGLKTLKLIWNLCDLDHDGQFTLEEFVAAHRCAEELRTGRWKVLPSTLPSEFLLSSGVSRSPPAMDSQAPPSQSDQHDQSPHPPPVPPHPHWTIPHPSRNVQVVTACQTAVVATDNQQTSEGSAALWAIDRPSVAHTPGSFPSSTSSSNTIVSAPGSSGSQLPSMGLSSSNEHVLTPTHSTQPEAITVASDTTSIASTLSPSLGTLESSAPAVSTRSTGNTSQLSAVFSDDTSQDASRDSFCEWPNSLSVDIWPHKSSESRLFEDQEGIVKVSGADLDGDEAVRIQYAVFYQCRRVPRRPKPSDCWFCSCWQVQPMPQSQRLRSGSTSFHSNCDCECSCDEFATILEADCCTQFHMRTDVKCNLLSVGFDDGPAREQMSFFPSDMLGGTVEKDFTVPGCHPCAFCLCCLGFPFVPCCGWSSNRSVTLELDFRRTVPSMQLSSKLRSLSVWRRQQQDRIDQLEEHARRRREAVRRQRNEAEHAQHDLAAADVRAELSFRVVKILLSQRRPLVPASSQPQLKMSKDELEAVINSSIKTHSVMSYLFPLAAVKGGLEGQCALRNDEYSKFLVTAMTPYLDETADVFSREVSHASTLFMSQVEYKTQQQAEKEAEVKRQREEMAANRAQQMKIALMAEDRAKAAQSNAPTALGSLLKSGGGGFASTFGSGIGSALLKAL